MQFPDMTWRCIANWTSNLNLSIL